MELSKELRELIKSEAASMHPDSKYEQGQAALLMKLGAVLALESTGWISVEERLPETQHNVLCCGLVDYGYFVMRGQYYYTGGKWFRDSDEYTKYTKIEPSHWMPLPTPPKA